MSASDDVPYFSRFLVKFIEIFAAGFATAVSGYMIAHLAGVLSSATPATVGTAIQVAPGASAVPSVPSGPPAKVPAPASAGANEPYRAPVQEANAPTDQPAQGTEPSHGDAAKAVVGRKHPQTDKHLDADKHFEADKHLETDTGAAASLSDSKRDQEGNRRAQDAVLDRVRAALANSNAKRTSPPDRPQQPAANGPRATTPIGPASPPAGDLPTAASSASPNSANPASPPVAQQVPQSLQPPVAQPLTEPTPLTAVEIPSRPVATVQTAPAPASQNDASMFPALDRLRHDPLAASDDAPRPPMPVGQ
jgi:hypothetical protein